MLRVSDDVMELVQLLNEEGYAILAGELMLEMGLGHEPDLLDADPDVNLQFGQSVDRPESEINRVPLLLDEQMNFALSFIELRLVSPMRALAEAEVLAGKLSFPEDKSPLADKMEESGRPIRLSFRSPSGEPDIEIKRADVPGGTTSIEELSGALSYLRQDI